MPDPQDASSRTSAEIQRLIELADAGHQEAAAELDRRGVEPPVIEPDHPGPLP